MGHGSIIEDLNENKGVRTMNEQPKTVTLGGMYGFQRLSQVLQSDAQQAAGLEGMAEVQYKLEDLSKHAEQLEDALENTAGEIEDLTDKLDHATTAFGDIEGKFNLAMEQRDFYMKHSQNLSQALENVLGVLDIQRQGSLQVLDQYEQEMELKASLLWPDDLPAPGNGHPSDRLFIENKVVVQPCENSLDAEDPRDQVERELHEAGIIEDPDVDGGLLG